MNDSPEHPALLRLRAELDAAREGIVALDELEAVRRDRVVAELRTAVPDVAGRAAREAGPDAVVAEISRFAVTVDGIASDGVPRSPVWRDIVRAATEAAAAAR